MKVGKTYATEGAAATDECELTGKEGGSKAEAEVAEDLDGNAELAVGRERKRLLVGEKQAIQRRPNELTVPGAW